MDTLIFPLVALIPALLCFFICLIKEKTETLIAENYQHEFNNSLKKNMILKYQNDIVGYQDDILKQAACRQKDVFSTGNGKLIAKKCPNCGAPLFGDHCDYCGSYFYYE